MNCYHEQEHVEIVSNVSLMGQSLAWHSSFLTVSGTFPTPNTVIIAARKKTMYPLGHGLACGWVHFYADLLLSCVRSSLKIVQGSNCKVIAFNKVSIILGNRPTYFK